MAKLQDLIDKDPSKFIGYLVREMDVSLMTIQRCVNDTSCNDASCPADDSRDKIQDVDQKSRCYLDRTTSDPNDFPVVMSDKISVNDDTPDPLDQLR